MKTVLLVVAFLMMMSVPAFAGPGPDVPAEQTCPTVVQEPLCPPAPIASEQSITKLLPTQTILCEGWRLMTQGREMYELFSYNKPCIIVDRMEIKQVASIIIVATDGTCYNASLEFQLPMATLCPPEAEQSSDPDSSTTK